MENITEVPFHVSIQIKKQFNNSMMKIREANQDRIFLITGREGSGKSLLARQFSYYCDRNFNLDDIAFTADQFEFLIRETKKKVIIFDEAFNGLSSKGALSKENRRLVKLLIECRQRNLIVFIVLPSIFLLEKYIAIFRSHACFNVAISKHNWKNRFYKVYNYQQKNRLFISGKQYMSYSQPHIHLKHRFYGNPIPTINEAEYDKKKLLAFKDLDKEEAVMTRPMLQRNALLYEMKEKYKLKSTTLSKLLESHNCPLNNSNISRILKEYPKKLTNDIDII